MTTLSSKPKKKFIVQKIIFAHSALEAIAKDNKTPVDEVWLDKDYMAESDKRAMGFAQPPQKS